MTGCSFCGLPADTPETHHHNEQKGDNDPDNLRPAHRRCHMSHHENDRAVDDLAEQRYGPRTPDGAAPGPSAPEP